MNIDFLEYIVHDVCMYNRVQFLPYDLHANTGTTSHHQHSILHHVYLLPLLMSVLGLIRRPSCSPSLGLCK